MGKRVKAIKTIKLSAKSIMKIVIRYCFVLVALGFFASAFSEILAIAIPVLRLNLQTTDTKIL